MNTEQRETELLEAAAALAAIELYCVGEARALPEPTPRSRWHESSMLARLGLRPQRLPVAPRWATIERLRRAR
jgi:hypothetical protein